MIILIRMRNLAIFALAVLSVSFIYIGYTGFGNSGGEFEPAISILEESSQNGLLTENLEYDISIADINDIINPEEINIQENFFAEFRIKRDRARALQIELLKENVNNPNSSQETINKAQDKILIISDNIAVEAHAENILQTKGYENSAVFIEEDYISVFIKKDELTEDDIARIGDLVVRASGCKLDQIVITPKN